jgi:hypothetical protein
MSENDLLFLPPSISKLQCLKILNLGKNCEHNTCNNNIHFTNSLPTPNDHYVLQYIAKSDSV